MFSTPEQIISRQFSTSSMDEMLDDIRHWDTDFRQLTPAQGPLWYTQILSPDIIYTESLLSCQTDQQGATPPGYRSFALMDPASSICNWNNQLFDQSSLVVKPRSNEFRATAAENFHVRIFSLRENKLAEIADQYFNYDWYKTIDDSGKVIKLTSAIVAKLTTLLRNLALHGNNLSASTATDPYSLQSRLQINLLAESIALELVSVLQDPASASRILPQHRYRSLISALDYIEQDPTNKLTVSTLCKHTNCSPRTLEYAFKQTFSMTPKRYLLSRQLNRTYNQLRVSDNSQESVTAIANHWGFNHTGQFAKDYFNLFAELPKETLKN